jgi:hypothetical protein
MHRHSDRFWSTVFCYRLGTREQQRMVDLMNIQAVYGGLSRGVVRGNDKRDSVCPSLRACLLTTKVVLSSCLHGRQCLLPLAIRSPRSRTVGFLAAIWTGRGWRRTTRSGLLLVVLLLLWWGWLLLLLLLSSVARAPHRFGPVELAALVFTEFRDAPYMFLQIDLVELGRFGVIALR